MSRLADSDVLDRVRQAITTAEEKGERRPGRGRLVKDIPGASTHQVREALRLLKQNIIDAAAAGNTETKSTDAASNVAGDSSADPADNDEPAGASSIQLAPTSASTQHPKPWPLVLIGVAAAVAVWSGWVDLGRMTGFGLVQPLPGLVDNFWINTAIVLPIGIEAYGGYALRTWLSSAVLSIRTRTYARWSALTSLVVGAGAQVASHLMHASELTRAPAWVTVLVSCVPVLVLGLATGLATLVRQDIAAAPGRPFVTISGH